MPYIAIRKCSRLQILLSSRGVFKVEPGRYIEISPIFADIDGIGIVSISAFRYRFFRYIDIVIVTAKISEIFDVFLYFLPTI